MWLRAAALVAAAAAATSALRLDPLPDTSRNLLDALHPPKAPPAEPRAQPRPRRAPGPGRAGRARAALEAKGAGAAGGRRDRKPAAPRSPPSAAVGGTPRGPAAPRNSAKMHGRGNVVESDVLAHQEGRPAASLLHVGRAARNASVVTSRGAQTTAAEDKDAEIARMKKELEELRAKVKAQPSTAAQEAPAQALGASHSHAGSSKPEAPALPDSARPPVGASHAAEASAQSHGASHLDARGSGRADASAQLHGASNIPASSGGKAVASDLWGASQPAAGGSKTPASAQGANQPAVSGSKVGGAHEDFDDAREPGLATKEEFWDFLKGHADFERIAAEGSGVPGEDPLAPAEPQAMPQPLLAGR